MDLANAVEATPGVSRAPRLMMEGVGSRVIRGPDWKWGKQVWIKSEKFCNFCDILNNY